MKTDIHEGELVLANKYGVVIILPPVLKFDEVPPTPDTKHKFSHFGGALIAVLAGMAFYSGFVYWWLKP